jgi:hypothetical protein
MAVTRIAPGTGTTNFGPPPGFDKVTRIGTGYSAASNTPGAVGAPVTRQLRIASVASSQTGVVEDSFVADGRMRVISVTHGAQAVTAIASFLLYNSTQAANVLGSTTPTTTSTTATSLTTPIVETGDVIQLKVTTDGSGALTSLHVDLTVQYLGAPTNLQS